MSSPNQTFCYNDPQGRRTGAAIVSDHYFHTCPLSVRTLQNIAKQNLPGKIVMNFCRKRQSIMILYIFCGKLLFFNDLVFIPKTVSFQCLRIE